MGIDVTVDLSGFELLLGDTNRDKAVDALAQQIFEDSQENVPVLTGQLYRSGRVSTGAEDVAGVSHRTLRWGAEYANPVYNMDSVVSPNISGGEAAPAWFEKAKSEHLTDWIGTAFDELFQAVS
jgi:hypothetical protein